MEKGPKGSFSVVLWLNGSLYARKRICSASDDDASEQADPPTVALYRRVGNKQAVVKGRSTGLGERHHWTNWYVISSIDLETIKRMGVWKSLRMVERYAAVATGHMERAIALVN